MALPALSPEQREAALQKAGEARGARSDLLAGLKAGTLTLAEVLGRDDDLARKTKVAQVIRALPGIGTWFAADARLGWWGPDGARRLVVATADPATLPPKATWYLVTNLPRPGSPREPESPHPAATLTAPTRIYGTPTRTERSPQRTTDRRAAA